MFQSDWSDEYESAGDAGAADSQSTEATVARIRQEWGPVIAALVSDSQGDKAATAQLDRFLEKLGVQEEWKSLSEILQRVRAGEREPISLLAGLDAVDMLIVGDLLEALAQPSEEVAAEEAESAPVETTEGGATAAPEAGDGEADLEARQAAAAETIARIRQEWAAVITAMVAGNQGDKTANLQLDRFLKNLSTQDEWQTLGGILERIRGGERDVMALMEGLDQVDSLIVGDVLEALGVRLNPGPKEVNFEIESEPELYENPPLKGDFDEPAVHGDQVTLDEFLSMVALACSSQAPSGLAEQLYGAAKGMAAQSDTTEEMRKLGEVLAKILIGNRNPDLSALPRGLALKVQALLEIITGKKK